MKTKITFILIFSVTIISAKIINFDVYDKFRSKPMTIWDSYPGQFPYYTHVIPQKLSPNDKADANVGGVIISKLWVVTVASATIGATQFKILFGVLNLSEPPKLAMTSKHWVTYPGFNAKELHWQTNDIGLLQLPQELSFNSFIQPITLDKNKDPQPYSGFEFVSCSYEKSKRGSLDLQWTFVMGVKDLACQNWYSSVYTSNSICTRLYPMRKQPKDACHWDGGSPLATVSDDGTATLVGIAPERSSGECTAKSPKEYLRIGPYYDWIKRIISIYPHPGQSMSIEPLKTSNRSKTSASMEKDMHTTETDTPATETDMPTMETELPIPESYIPAIEVDLPATDTDLLAEALDFPIKKIAMAKKGSKKRAQKFKYHFVKEDTDLPITETEEPITETDWPNTETEQQTTMSELPLETETPTTATDLPKSKINSPTAETDLPTKMSNQSTTLTVGPTSTTYNRKTESDLPTYESISGRKGYKSNLAIPQFISAENTAEEPFFADNIVTLQPIAHEPHLHPVKREISKESYLNQKPKHAPLDPARKRYRARLAQRQARLAKALRNEFKANIHPYNQGNITENGALAADDTTKGEYLGDDVALSLPKSITNIDGKSAQINYNDYEYDVYPSIKVVQPVGEETNNKNDGILYDTYTQRSSYTLMIGDKPKKINLNVDVKLLMNDKNRRYSIG